MKDIKTKIAKKLAGSIEQLSWTEIMDNLEYPPEPHMGDLALPCFKLSRVMRKSPMAIADSLVDSLDIDVVERCESKSGYLNIFINREYLVNNVLKTIVEKKKKQERAMSMRERLFVWIIPLPILQNLSI